MKLRIIKLGAVLGFFAVFIGAFGHHLLESRISAQNLEIFETGVRYHFFHAIAVLLVAALYNVLDSKLANLSANLFAIGVIVFSGSLYLLAITNMRWLGAITPIGGLCFMAGWILLALSARTKPNPES